jgi:hypothetical protein
MCLIRIGKEPPIVNIRSFWEKERRRHCTVIYRFLSFLFPDDAHSFIYKQYFSTLWRIRTSFFLSLAIYLHRFIVFGTAGGIKLMIWKEGKRPFCYSDALQLFFRLFIHIRYGWINVYDKSQGNITPTFVIGKTK